MKTLVIGCAVLASALGAGCAGGRTSIAADGANYPVSMSQGVRDESGELVEKDRRVVVGTFDDKRTAWGMLYSGVKLTPKKDISKEVNRQVARAKGDAIVNLRVATETCALDFIPILNILPIWPGCTNVYVKGDIIRVEPKATKAPPSPAAPQAVAQSIGSP